MNAAAADRKNPGRAKAEDRGMYVADFLQDSMNGINRECNSMLGDGLKKVFGDERNFQNIVKTVDAVDVYDLIIDESKNQTIHKENFCAFKIDRMDDIFDCVYLHKHPLLVHSSPSFEKNYFYTSMFTSLLLNKNMLTTEERNIVRINKF